MNCFQRLPCPTIFWTVGKAYFGVSIMVLATVLSTFPSIHYSLGRLRHPRTSERLHVCRWYQLLPRMSSSHQDNHLQLAADYSQGWADSNDMKNNPLKTKEMVFTYSKSLDLVPLTISGTVIERVKHSKLSPGRNPVCWLDMEWAHRLNYQEMQPAFIPAAPSQESRSAT